MRPVATELPPAVNSGQHETPRLQGLWLTLARIGIITFGISFIVLFVTAIPFRYQALTTLCTPNETCQALHLSQLEIVALPTWLTLEAYASYQIALEVVLSLIGLVVATLIFYRVSHTRMGLLAAVFMIFVGFSTEVVIALAEAVPLVDAFYTPGWAAFSVLLWLFVMVFPNGKVEPDWVRRRFPMILLAVVGIQLTGLFIFFQGLVRLDTLHTALWYSTFVFSFGVQVVRYRRYVTPEQRQQVKWALVGIGSGMLNFIFWVFILEPETSPIPGGAPRLTWNLLGGFLNLITASLFPITLAYSILRRRLWDVDRIINRALVYSTLTGILMIIYIGTVVLLQRVVLSGQDSTLVIAGSTLLIAVLFAPLRRRIQILIDRRFYRSKYDGKKALAAFAATARSQVDLDALTDELLRVVGETVQPRQVSVWLRPDPEGGAVRLSHTPGRVGPRQRQPPKGQ